MRIASSIKRLLPNILFRLLRIFRGVVVVMVALCLLSVTQLSLFKRFIPLLKLELALVDIRFRLRGYVAPSTKIAVIGINASSLEPTNFAPDDVSRSEALQLMQRPFPWSRKVYALLLDKLMAAGAKAVVIDVLFFGEASGDDELAQA